MQYEFYGEKFSVPTINIGLISLLVGIVGGIYGIGGGAIIAPLFVAFFWFASLYSSRSSIKWVHSLLPLRGVIFYQILSYFYTGIAIAPDWILGLLKRTTYIQ